MQGVSPNTDYLTNNAKGNLITLKHYVYSVSKFRPLGLCQETNNCKQRAIGGSVPFWMISLDQNIEF